MSKRFIILLFSLSLTAGFLSAPAAFAAGPTISSSSAIPDFNFQVPLPGHPKIKGEDIENGSALGLYIADAYKIAVGITMILGFLWIFAAGFLWMTGGAQKARTMIVNGSIGLGIALSSFIILNTINPNLVRLQSLSVYKVKKIEYQFGEKALYAMDHSPGAGRTVAAPVGDGFNGVPRLKQGQNPWGPKPYGLTSCTNAPTYSASGCAPTALAMALKYNGIATDPEKVGKFAIDQSYRQCNVNGTTSDLFENINKNSDWNTVKSTRIANKDCQVAINHLKNKNAVLFVITNGSICGYGGHALLATGIDDQGRVRVNDPEVCPGGSTISGIWATADTDGITAVSQDKFCKDFFPAFWVISKK